MIHRLRGPQVQLDSIYIDRSHVAQQLHKSRQQITRSNRVRSARAQLQSLHLVLPKRKSSDSRLKRYYFATITSRSEPEHREPWEREIAPNTNFSIISLLSQIREKIRAHGRLIEAYACVITTRQRILSRGQSAVGNFNASREYLPTYICMHVIYSLVYVRTINARYL